MSEELVRRAQSGDRSAFEELVKEHQKRVYNLAYRMTGDPEDAMDVSQEAFLRAYRGLDSFKGDSSFATWLYRITVHVCGDLRRKNSAGADRTVSLTTINDDGQEQETEIPDLRYSPEASLERKELARAVGETLASMPEDFRAVLVMRENAGMSYEEIGNKLDIKPGTVKSRIFRAREFLRRKLIESGNFYEPYASNRSTGA